MLIFNRATLDGIHFSTCNNTKYMYMYLHVHIETLILCQLKAKGHENMQNFTVKFICKVK